MATSIEHYKEAEQLLRAVRDLEHGNPMGPELIAEAQVHATLALAAATALNVGEGGEDYEVWRKHASTEWQLLSGGE